MPYLCTSNSIEFGISSFKFPVLTAKAYKKLLGKRGTKDINKVISDVCQEKGCRFLGFEIEEEYVYAGIRVVG